MAAAAETKVAAAATAVATKDAKAEGGKAKEHALESGWSFHFARKLQTGQKYDEYTKNLLELGSFNTMEGFWRHYSFLTAPDDIPKDHDLHMFRAGLVPAWESFPDGGAWIIKVRKRNGVIKLLWEQLLFACVGELFDEPKELAGVCLSTRVREDNLSVWVKHDNTKTGEHARFKIGEKMREILGLDPNIKVEYKKFDQSLQDGSTFRNAQQFVYQASPVFTAAAGISQPPPLPAL